MEIGHNVRFRGVWAFGFLSVFLIFISPVHGEGLYTQTDELSCGDVKVQAFTTCTSCSTVLTDSECTEQHFLFINSNEEMSRKVTASGQLKERYAAHGKKMGKWLDALAGAWACLRGRHGSFVIIGYANGGNCPHCEWYEIFDLKGHMLASSRVPTTATKKGEERIRDAFGRKYNALGLPMPWPDSSIRLFRIFEHPYKP